MIHILAVVDIITSHRDAVSRSCQKMCWTC